MKIHHLLLIGMFGTLSLSGCDTNEGPAEQTGEALDDAGEEIQDAADDAGDAVEEACEEAREGVDADDRDC